MYIIRNSSGQTFQVTAEGHLHYTTFDGYKVNPSRAWRVVGAVECKTVFGNYTVTKRYSFEDIVNGKVPWKHKNGRQRCRIMDYDHGSERVWMNDHNVII
jgi:hypothetical protein